MKVFIFDFTLKVSKRHLSRNVIDIEADDEVQATVEAKRYVDGVLAQQGLTAANVEGFVLLGSRPV